MTSCGQILVLISAGAEWQALTSLIQPANLGHTPFGEWLSTTFANEEILFVHGGWGKIAAAASTQYAIDHWKPELLINLGTCGGIAGAVEPGDVLLVERTLVYDIVEQMGDFDQAIAHYTTELDLAWIRTDLPAGVRRSLLVSADRDLLPEDMERLLARYGAVAADWESGAIAWVAAHNQVPCLILRGVTDLVEPGGGEAYGRPALFASRTASIMQLLLETLPFFLKKPGALQPRTL